MKLFDVNVLVYAYREDAVHHTACREFVERTIPEPEAFGLTPIVLSGFLRITTHRKIFKTPSPLSGAVEFVDAILHQPHAISVRPGPRHWNLFIRLSTEASATGNLIPDAYIAAIAIEAGCDLVTTDKDFARFPSLKCIDPLVDHESRGGQLPSSATKGELL